MRIPKGKMCGGLMKCYGGPWNGRTMFIPTGGTMYFRVKDCYGMYTGLGEWFNA